jgi:RND superfamily putative drug exporter
MQAAMDKLGAFIERRRWLVLGTWVVLLLAAAPFAARQTEHLTGGGFTVPGSGSENVDTALKQFPGAERESLGAVLRPARGADAADMRAAVDRVAGAADRLANVSIDRRAVARAKHQAAGGGLVIVPLETSGARNDIADMAVDLRKEVGAGEGVNDGVTTYLVGQTALWAGMQDLTKEDLASAERAGFPIVLIILLAVFGSLAAAALPLALGVFSVGITGAAIFFLSQATAMSVFTTNVASMIGIGVAVDYSLFVLARYREEIHAGATPEEARGISLRTSGLAVTFSGITVMVSLAGLWLVDSTTIRSMAMGAIIVVAVSVLAAVSLLPALMSVLGRRAYARGRIATIAGLVVRNWRTRVRRGPSTIPGSRGPGFWARWTERVSRRPVVSAIASGGVLLVLAIPALSLNFGNGALRQFPETNETRVGAELAAKELGAGSQGPTQVVATFHDGTGSTPDNRRALNAYVGELRKDPETAKVDPPRLSRDRRSVLIAIQPRHDVESQRAEDFVHRLRDRADSGQGLAQVATVDVGGATGFNLDFVELVSGSMWKILVFVLTFSYLVLLVLLRSVLLPLKAVLMNLLSVAAAYGVLVAIFQWGWVDGFLGFHSLGYIQAMSPPFLLAIVFGLSMDYEVFLLSRIRERYDATGDTKTAVVQGLEASARTISSAALIMVAVFAVFAATGVPSIKEIGLGLSVAIALDATLVRLILVPATMEIMGRWNWWLPKPLQRVLPRTSIEASGHRREGATAGA